MGINYTPLDVERLEKQSAGHDANAANIALLLVGTLSLGVMLVMLVVIVQSKLNVKPNISETPKAKNAANVDQEAPEEPIPTEEPTPTEETQEPKSEASPAVEGVATESSNVDMPLENLEGHPSRIVTTPVPTSMTPPPSPRSNI